MNDSPKTTDWATLYGALQRAAQIPNVDGIRRSGTSFVVRGMFVDLATALAVLPAAPAEGTSLSIFCDVLRVPAGETVTLSGVALVVAARRIEVMGPASITLDYGRSALSTIAVYALELAGTWSVNATGIAGSPDVALAVGPVDPYGVVISLVGKTVTREGQGGIEDPKLGVGSEFEMSLTTIFQFSTLLAAAQPDLARSMLEWIRQSTRDVRAVADLHLQATSALVLLDADSNTKSLFVPTLSRQVYADLSAAFVDAAQAYESQYQRFVDKGEALANRLNAASVMLENQKDGAGYVDALVAQSQKNLDETRLAVDRADETLRKQQDVVDFARTTFLSGLRNWEYDKKVEAAFKIIGGVVEFGAIVAELVAGKAEAAGEALKAANQAAESVKKASKLADTLKQIAKASETLHKLYELSSKLAEVGKDVAKASSVASETYEIDLPTTAAGDAIAVWDVFKLEARAALADALAEGIDGAKDYDVQLQSLAVYAQSLTNGRVAFIRASQELTRIKLQRAVADRQAERLEALVASLGREQAADEAAAQLFYQRNLDMKRSYFLSAQSYVAAYRYWALALPKTRPSISAPIAAIKADLARMMGEYAAALEALNPPPQATSGLECVIDDPRTLESLRARGEATFAIDLTNPTFLGLGRVRVHTVRVYVDGLALAAAVRGASAPTVSLHIATSGTYRDRLGGKTWSFAASPLSRIFKHGFGDEDRIFVDGRVADEQQFAYFEPTPFTEWTVKLVEPEGWNLKGVTALRIRVSGSAIGA